MKFTPREYQKKAIRWLVSKPEAALFLDPGLGKSSCTLAAFKALQKAGKVRKMLVVCPLQVAYNVWTQERGGEIRKWDEFRHFKVVLLHGPKKNERLEEDADIYVVNVDGVSWLADNGGFRDLFKRGVDVLCVDELSKFKHPKTRRFKTLKPFLSRFKRRWGLTGSPASNGLIDLFGQAYVLDLGKALGPYITHYRYKYFEPLRLQGAKSHIVRKWVPIETAKQDIYTQLEDLALSMQAQDHLDLPKLVEQNHYVQLPKKARRAYEELEKEFITLIGKDVVTAVNAAAASGKCRQVASGGLYTQEGGKRKSLKIHDEKTDVLKDLVDELQGQPLLVSYEFDHDFDRIQKALGKIPAINGHTKASKAQEIIVAWNQGEIPVLAGHPAAMGHGLNLQGGGCSHICFYSLTWDFELYDQLVRRVYRQGSTAKRVVVHRLLARDTLDEVVAQVLGSKKRSQNALFEALKRLKR